MMDKNYTHAAKVLNNSVNKHQTVLEYKFGCCNFLINRKVWNLSKEYGYYIEIYELIDSADVENYWEEYINIKPKPWNW